MASLRLFTSANFHVGKGSFHSRHRLPSASWSEQLEITEESVSQKEGKSSKMHCEDGCLSFIKLSTLVFLRLACYTPDKTPICFCLKILVNSMFTDTSMLSTFHLNK